MLSIPSKSTAYHYFLLGLSGTLLWLSWPHSGFTLLIFFSWVPLLWAEEKITSPFGFFFGLWGAFLIWNIGTTWWIWNSTGPGAVGAIVANSLIMCFPVMAYRFTKKYLPLWQSLVAFILYWITYEFIHHRWDLSWPWLTLGNVFATKPGWIQWYRFTGTTGGSLWVLGVNALIFYEITVWTKPSTPLFTRLRRVVLGLLFIPLILGGVFLPKEGVILSESQVNLTPNIVVVQPNVEPYNEKFNTDPELLAQSLIDLSKSKIDSNTRMVVWPETALPAQAWEHEIDSIPIFKKVFAFLHAYPNLQLVTGIDSYKLWGSQNPGGLTIRQMNNGWYYEAFNTALGKSSADTFSLYHKSKLVPGVEALPSWLGFMASVFNDFGGINGSLGRSDSARVFSATGNPYRPAPVICYESIYSDYMTEYTRRGANIITVITNDGWWGNTAGHHQHMNYARLRAIETGLWVARSANTGISCFIDPYGNIYQPQPWDTQTALKMSVPPVENLSFYARHFDWLSRLLLAPAIAFFMLTLFLKWKKRKT